MPGYLWEHIWGHLNPVFSVRKGFLKEVMFQLRPELTRLTTQESDVLWREETSKCEGPKVSDSTHFLRICVLKFRVLLAQEEGRLEVGLGLTGTKCRWEGLMAFQ